jgi:hypothetical protein
LRFATQYRQDPSLAFQADSIRRSRELEDMGLETQRRDRERVGDDSESQRRPGRRDGQVVRRHHRSWPELGQRGSIDRDHVGARGREPDVDRTGAGRREDHERVHPLFRNAGKELVVPGLERPRLADVGVASDATAFADEAVLDERGLAARHEVLGGLEREEVAARARGWKPEPGR